MISQQIGSAIAEWGEDEPLRWVIRETVGKGKSASTTQISCDLTPLSAHYGHPFLKALKALHIARRTKVALITISRDLERIRDVLLRTAEHFERVCREQAIPPVVFERIDSNLLLGVAAIKDEFAPASLSSFRALHTFNRDNSELFSEDLHRGDFPSSDREGKVGELRRRIVASALSRSVLVHILNITEAAFETGALDLGRYAFSRLMLSRAARPATYRLLQCKDLRIDNTGGTTSYFLSLTIPKARRGTPPTAVVPINREVGLLLEKQREAVSSRLDHLIQQKNLTLDTDAGSARYTIGDLPLFPTIATFRGTGRKITQERLGVLTSSSQFSAEYVLPLKILTGKSINCTAIRHTMGTQLAIAGCSAGTIAAVLLHASDRTATIYTDLIFEGAIDELSDSLEDAFVEHFPVFKEFISVRDQVDPAKRILSESGDRTRRETTGECGRDRICEYAPLSCYGCHRFIPAYDVDHTINLDVVNEEIQDAEVGGLQRQADVKRYKHLANRIRVVINVCDLKRAAVGAQSNEPRAT